MAGISLLKAQRNSQGRLLNDGPIISTTFFIGHWRAHLFLVHKEVSMARRYEKQRQRKYSRTFCFWKKSLGTRLMLISRMYRFSNWQNALNCLTQESCAPLEDAGNRRSVEIGRMNYRITKVSDWVEKRWRSGSYPRLFVIQMIPT
jgi:hypothetical protein